MKEIRVYGIDPNSMIYDNRQPNDLSNNEFIEESEKQGFIWSLGGFSDDFNNEMVPYDLIIRFIIIETSEEAKNIPVNFDQDMRDFIYS